jgi:hypothetical protein
MPAALDGRVDVALGGLDDLLTLDLRSSNRLGFFRTCLSVGREPEGRLSSSLESS